MSLAEAVETSKRLNGTTFGDAVPTGVPGLDYITAGGYARSSLHLIEGAPGTGKTTLALQFLMDGRERGERGLYVSLSETREELMHNAATHGWSLEGIEIFELIPPELTLDPNRDQSVLYASDLELGETVGMVMKEVDRIKPHRVVFDSVAEIRLLSQTPLRHRRQVLALKHFLAKQGCTALFLDDLTQEIEETSLHSLAHAVIRLQQTPMQFGGDRRRLRVFKMRGREFRGGFHDYVIRTGGFSVHPRLIAAEHHSAYSDAAPVTSGIAELDKLLGGGLDRGTGTMIIGPAGTGKSMVCLQFLKAALERGEAGLVVSFDESRRVLLKRAIGVGVNLETYEASGQLTLKHVDPAEFSPGELAGMIRDSVEQGARIVVIDSLSGYQNALPEESFLALQMHELLTYLGQQGVVTLVVLAQHGLVGPMHSSVDLTYVSDNVLLLRFFEAQGEIRRTLSVLKKRTGEHEATLRELLIRSDRLQVGPVLDKFQGVLTGVPSFVGASSSLLQAQDNGG
ncbi:ATPase domain-containing protein [Phenylobacterium montanum]|uniref:ATPase domain-containing protein n=1 Tax=Phenylobacterium montanum TaxID=2823693 RepID=UPI0020112C6E|nr:ATPase domain-containing protein [Caulobacter sp. S6]